MKQTLTLFATLIGLVAFGQSEVTLPKHGETLEQLIPDDWNLLESITGDLNQDGITDLVFAIQGTDPEKIESEDGFGTEMIDLNTRILAIYFGEASGGFHQQLVSEEFIIQRYSTTMDEPFVGFDINKKGVLDIHFTFFYSMGSWMMSNHTYRFRFQNGEFALIGYDSYEADRGTGETTDRSVNFLTRKIKITKGNFSESEDESVEWREFQLEKLMTIESIGEPFGGEFNDIF